MQKKCYQLIYLLSQHPPPPITQDIYVTVMYSPTNTVSDLHINMPLGDCSWKLAPQLNGMEAAYRATSHIKEGMHHLWVITCKFGLSCALYTIKSLVNFSQLPGFYADSCRKKRNWFEKNKLTTNPISVATLHTEAADLDMPSSENTTVPPLSSECCTMARWQT